MIGFLNDPRNSPKRDSVDTANMIPRSAVSMFGSPTEPVSPELAAELTEVEPALLTQKEHPLVERLLDSGKEGNQPVDCHFMQHSFESLLGLEAFLKAQKDAGVIKHDYAQIGACLLMEPEDTQALANVVRQPRQSHRSSSTPSFP